MAQENPMSFGENTSDYKDLCMMNPAVSFEDTWSWKNKEDDEERNESCFMDLDSPKVYLDPIS